jgi:hypothetical protein
MDTSRCTSLITSSWTNLGRECKKPSDALMGTKHAIDGEDAEVAAVPLVVRPLHRSLPTISADDYFEQGKIGHPPR